MKSRNYFYHTLGVLAILVMLWIMVVPSVRGGTWGVAEQSSPFILNFTTVPLSTIHWFSMDVDPGWNTEGEWSFGVPLGGGSHCGDPNSGYTGNNVYGYNLEGDYDDDMPELHLTSAALDCSGYENLTLKFRRWLGVESASYDNAKVEVSNDGSNWTIVWEHTGGSFCDGQWIECQYDISTVADGQPAVYIRWTMGPTDIEETYPGWNIDDVCLLGDVIIDDLIITPSEGLTSCGCEGGPFTPSDKKYTLTNNGESPLSWTASATQPWLDVTPTSGTLEPSDSDIVEVSLKVDVNTLPPGDYNDTVTFINTTSGDVQTRDVTLEVTAIPGEIDVTDSISPVDDLNMPFGEVFVGLSRIEQITITNTNPDYELIITDISLNGRLGGTTETSGISIALPNIAGGFKDLCISYLLSGWACPEQPASEMVIPGGYRVLSDKVKVLLLVSGDDPTILRIGLTAFTDIDTVDYFNTSLAVPTEADLAAYDVVVVMSNVNFYDAIQTGNVLADYVDAGGKVTQAVATFATGDTWELAGRFVTEGYEPFIHNPGEFFSHNLGSFDAEHPIMDGVTTLTDGFPVGVSLQPGAEWVADWDNGTSLVATKSGNVVGINIFAFDFGDFTGDVSLLFHNAIVWLLNIAKGFELELSGLPSLPLTIPPLGSIDFNVVFEPTEAGEYESAVLIKSSDEDEPEIEVRLSGEAIPDSLEIVPDDESEFSGHPGGPFVPSKVNYELTNGSTDEVITWSAGKIASWFDVEPNSGTINPGDTNTVEISINEIADTLEIGDYNDTLVFTNITTSIEQIRRVALTVFTSPKIWIDPAEGGLNVTIYQGQTTTETLTIGNKGDADLNFTLYGSEMLCGLSVGNTSAATVETAEENKIALEYQFGEPVVTTGAEYDLVRIEGLELYERTGAPIVPVRPVTVLVPFGKKVTASKIILLDTHVLPGTYRLLPAQEPIPLSYRGVVERTEPNPVIYGQAAPWPGIEHEEVATQSKRGYQLFVVNLFPLQYVPATGRIMYTTRLRLEIELEDALTSNVIKLSDAIEQQLLATVDNPDTLRDYPETDTSVKKLGLPTSLPSGGPYQYVIITNETLEAAPGPWNFQALRDAKIARGITATIVTTDWIYSNYDGTRPGGGSDNQTRIRNFLIDAYQTWGTEYALLGGIDSIIAARKFWVDNQEDIPCDMYYGCVEPAACTFDYDADGRYGEPTDGVGGGEVDLYAEIYVGRAAVENAAELGNFIRKTLAYDSTVSEYLPLITMLGEYLGFGSVSEYAKDAMEQIRLGGDYDGYFTYGFENHLQPDFYDFDTSMNLYDTDYTWPKSELIGLMNDGTHIFNHLGHANYTYDMKLDTSDLASLSNTDYFFAYSQGCMPGGFDTTDCFAEVITSMEYGAFAVIMNARYGWGRYNSTDGPSHRFDRQFWDAVLNEDMLEMGRANQDSKEDNLWDINGSCIRWCYYELNLFGDPEQQFRFSRKCDWIEFVPNAGTVVPDDSNDVEVVFDAGELEVGDYCGEIIISSNDDYTPVLFVPVMMTIEPDVLVVMPEDGFESIGATGGPFVPESKGYTLTNNGDEQLNWTAVTTESWLDVNPDAGTLYPAGGQGDSVEVVVSINPSANSFEPGTYTAVVTFTNLISGIEHNRVVTLTVIPVDYFTEFFDLQNNDMTNQTASFTPNGSESFYSACAILAAGFATDPNGGMTVSLGDDDYEEIILGGDAEVCFYGQSYDSFYIGSNGYITFGGGDTEFEVSLENHFNMPRISALFDDLDLSTNGTVSWKQLSDRIAVTFENVPEYSLSNTNNFQVEMFFNGTIRVTWLGIDAHDGLVGLSEGNGLPSNFAESNLSEYSFLCDFDGDCDVDFADYTVLAFYWWADCDAQNGWCQGADFEPDGDVDLYDLTEFTEHWFEGIAP